MSRLYDASKMFLPVTTIIGFGAFMFLAGQTWRGLEAKVEYMEAKLEAKVQSVEAKDAEILSKIGNHLTRIEILESFKRAYEMNLMSGGSSNAAKQRRRKENQVLRPIASFSRNVRRNGSAVTSGRSSKIHRPGKQGDRNIKGSLQCSGGPRRGHVLAPPTYRP